MTTMNSRAYAVGWADTNKGFEVCPTSEVHDWVARIKLAVTRCADKEYARGVTARISELEAIIGQDHRVEDLARYMNSQAERAHSKLELANSEADRLGQIIADNLFLKRDLAERERWATGWGTKTNAGLARMLLRILIEPMP